MSKGKYNLLVVSHPDDETIFFAGLIMRGGAVFPRRPRGAKSARALKKMSHPLPWKIICVTDGNADGQGALRRRQFKRACSFLGVDDAEWWGFQDKFEARLPVTELSERLRSMPRPETVFSHGVLGEYGHPHHQDVCMAVHEAFQGHGGVYSTAFNAYPEISVELTEAEFQLKARILTKIYGSETSRFLNLLPATASESFVRVGLEEVRAIYQFLATDRPLAVRRLHHYAWLRDFIPRLRNPTRPF